MPTCPLFIRNLLRSVQGLLEGAFCIYSRGPLLFSCVAWVFWPGLGRWPGPCHISDYALHPKFRRVVSVSCPRVLCFWWCPGLLCGNGEDRHISNSVYVCVWALVTDEGAVIVIVIVIVCVLEVAQCHTHIYIYIYIYMRMRQKSQ